MRILRHLIFVPFLFATVLIGLWAVRATIQHRAGPVPLCEILANKYLYSGLNLTISGRLTGNAVHDLGCGGKYGKWANVEFVKQPDFDGLHADLDKLNTATEFAYSDVIFSGTFQYVGENCISLDSSIKDAKLVSASPVRVNKVQ